MKVVWLAALALVLPVHASEWVAVTTAADGDAHFYDRDKLHVEDGGIIYWRRIEFRMPLPMRSALAQSGLYRERIDCAARELRTLGYLYYAADGSIIEDVYAPDAPAVPIADGTPVEQLEKLLCPLVASAKDEDGEIAESGDELQRLRQEVEALQTHVHELRQGLQVQDSAAGEAAR